MNELVSSAEEDKSKMPSRLKLNIRWSSARRLLVSLLLLIQVSLLAFSATKHSPTHLEPAFLAAGVSHWELGRFEQYRVNPPFPRLIATLPVVLLGITEDWTHFDARTGIRSEYQLGQDLFSANEDHALWLLIYGRWACIPFFLIGSITAYIWSKEMYGDSAGLCTLFLWTFEPNLLAHGELLTPDSACVSFNLLACYCFWRWIGNPSLSSCLFTGFVLGAAQASKMTALLLYPIFGIIWFASNVFSRESVLQALRHSRLPLAIAASRPPFCQFLLIVGVSIYMLNLCYGFDGSLTPLRDFTFVSRSLAGKPESIDGNFSGNRFAAGIFGGLPLPLPKQYVLGFDLQKKDFESFTPPSYLRGEWQVRGWWYYYVYGLAVKLPVGILVLFAFTLLCRIASILRHPPTLGEGILVLPAVALLCVASSQTSFNLHLRYVLPSVAPILVFVGQAISPDVQPLLIRRFFVPPLLLYVMLGTVFVYPHQLAYFNDFVGLKNGRQHLLGSSLDWGQDLLLVREYVTKHSNEYEMADIILITRSPPMPQLFKGVKLQQDDAAACMVLLRPAVYIVSINVLQGEQYRLTFIANRNYAQGIKDSCKELNSLNPVGWVGLTHVVYDTRPKVGSLDP